MKSDEQFEQRLQRRPLRQVPSAWREEILEAARAAAPRYAPRQTPDAPWWRELLWPCPQAWAALAAAWLMIAGLNLLSRESSVQTFARPVAPPSPQMRELLQQQEQLFAELVGPVEKPHADRPKPATPQPRSSLRSEFFNA